jgi:hypothetical protein
MKPEEMESLVKKIAEQLTATYELEDHGSGVSRSVPLPPAPAAEIAAFEKKHKLKFPPSYRQFLLLHNGWEHFWLDMTLTGVSGKPAKAVLDEVKETVEWQQNDLTSDMGELTPAKIKEWEAQDPSNLYLPNHFCFGSTFAGEFFVFDRYTLRDDGEMQVVFWNIGSGVDENERHESFADLLESVGKRVEAHYNKLTKKKPGKAKGK